MHFLLIDIDDCTKIFHYLLYKNEFLFQNLVTRDGECPSVFSNVWVQDPNKQIWSKGFLLLRDKKLYLSYKVQVVAKFLRTGKQKESSFYPVSLYACARNHENRPKMSLVKISCVSNVA